MKVAVVCDWLVTYAGAERVLEQILKVFPEADLFAVVDFLPQGQRGFIQNKPVHTTFIQRLPMANRKYRSYLPLMPIAVEQLDLSAYGLVISSSHCVAKGILTGPDQVHISYVYTPIRYAWDLQHQYLREAGLMHGLKSVLARAILHYMRLWDTRTSNGVDYFVCDSRFIAKRIWKCYRREAKVIYPPVNIDRFSCCEEKSEYYVTVSRMVPYKKMDLIVEAFSRMPDKKLIVVGDGPDFKKIKGKAAANVKLVGYASDDALRELLQHAKAFVFAAEEDFGIAPVEAQACGTPVIAYGRGGALETVRGMGIHDQPTGLFFPEQTVPSLQAAVERFEKEGGVISYQDCRKNAERFSEKVFREQFREYVEQVLAKEGKSLSKRVEEEK
jgi:glycosyltransferase involved in cell wall biosynthesis